MLTSLPLFQQNENIFASKFPQTVLYNVIKGPSQLRLGWISWYKSLKIAHFATFLVVDTAIFRAEYKRRKLEVIIYLYLDPPRLIVDIVNVNYMNFLISIKGALRRPPIQSHPHI